MKAEGAPVREGFFRRLREIKFSSPRLAPYGFQKKIKRRLVLGFQNTHLAAALSEGGAIKRFEKILIRESDGDAVAARVRALLGSTRPESTLLILARAEVLQKEICIGTETPADLGEFIKHKVEELLPYPAQEMAYGFSLFKDTGRGLLLAVPEKHLMKTLVFLNQIGASPTEITTEDQTLSWLLKEREERLACLLMDRQDGRHLFLYCLEDRIRFSRSFECDNADERISLQEMLQEISLSLIEEEKKPEKIFLTGEWDHDASAEIRTHFSLPVQILMEDGANLSREVPTPFAGAALYPKYPLISLLPTFEKIKRLQESKRGLGLQTLRAFAVFFLLAAASFLIRSGAMDLQRHSLEAKITRLSREAAESQKIAASLEKIRRAQKSKERILNLLKYLSAEVPATIHLQEIRIDSEEFIFSGESSSHALISEIVQVLEKAEGVRAPKLERTDLKKRLNEDYYEFKVSAKWKT